MRKHSLRRTRSSRLSMFLAMTALVLTSCGGGTEKTINDVSGIKPVTTTPPGKGPVNKVTWALPYGEPTTLDPVKVGDFSPNTVVANLCDNLLRTNPDFSVGPAIARRWKQADDRTVVFDIRDDVRFASGRRLTADDVVFSLRRASDPKTESIFTTAFANVKSIDRTSQFQVTVRFSKPDASFERQMATVAGAIMDRKAVEAAGKHIGTPDGVVPCSGPFRLAKWKAGERITLVANKDYWDPALRPKVKTLDFRFISDTAALTNALVSGGVDGSFEIPPSSLPRLLKAENGKLYIGPGTEVQQLFPTSPTGPLSDPDVRWALALSMDRAGLAKTVFNGAASPDRTIAPPASWESDPAADTYRKAYDELPDLSRDLKAARKRLEGEPLAKQPFTVAVLAGDQVQQRLANLIQSSAKQIGLNMRVKLLTPTDFSNLFYVSSARQGIDGVLTLGYIENADPINRLSLFVPKAGLFNWTKWDNPRVARLVAKAQQTPDPQARAELLNEAQLGYMKDMLVIPILNVRERVFLSNKISGTTTSFAYTQRPWAATLGSAS